MSDLVYLRESCERFRSCLTDLAGLSDVVRVRCSLHRRTVEEALAACERVLDAARFGEPSREAIGAAYGCVDRADEALNRIVWEAAVFAAREATWRR